jgi:hypothetical protein
MFKTFNAEVVASWNVMTHAQKPDFVFRRNGRVHLNRRRRQFSRLLADELCASALTVGSNAGYTMFRGSENGTGYPRHSPVSSSLPLPCVTVFHHISTGVYAIGFTANPTPNTWPSKCASSLRASSITFRINHLSIGSNICLETHFNSLHEVGSSWASDSHSAVQKTPRLIWTSKIINPIVLISVE